MPVEQGLQIFNSSTIQSRSAIQINLIWCIEYLFCITFSTHCGPVQSTNRELIFKSLTSLKMKYGSLESKCQNEDNQYKNT